MENISSLSKLFLTIKPMFTFFAMLERHMTSTWRAAFSFLFQSVDQVTFFDLTAALEKRSPQTT